MFFSRIKSEYSYPGATINNEIIEEEVLSFLDHAKEIFRP